MIGGRLAVGGEGGEIGAVEEDREGGLGIEHGGQRRAAADVPAAEALEILERGGAAEPALGGARSVEEIEVVAHEPDDARSNEAVEQIGSDHVVVGRAYRFPDVVQQGRRPEGAIRGLAPGEIEGLKRVEEGVPFGVVARILTDAVEVEEEIEEIEVHARGGAPEGDAHCLTHGARSHPLASSLRGLSF